MNTKLIWTIEQEKIHKAKKSARNKNRTLSDIIENYLEVLTNDEHDTKDKDLNPIVKSLKGPFIMPKTDLDYKEELRNRLEDFFFLWTKYLSIQMLLTRNIKDYRKSKLTILTPEAYLKGLV